MRFGHFFYPMKFDDSRDDQEIQECLDEAELVEALGFDAIWIAEHYFTGECVYGDPLVFASALAVKTSRVLLGFGIIELPLHNPVRVAMQTALLDNLSRGRLVVGTAKGSNYNAFEYTGFGTDPAVGAAQMEEAEKLMVTAWTTDNVDFQGEHYQVAFPSVRPRPYQKPHPPLARACINRESIIEMARIGRPILLRGRSTNSTAADIALYRDTMGEAGFSEEAIEHNLDQIWVWREMHVAETDDQAMDEFLPANLKAWSIMQDYRQQWNPKEFPMSQQAPPVQRDGYGEHPDPDAAENLVGSPRRVAEQIEQMRNGGIRNLMLTNRGLVSREATNRSLKLLAEQVMPKFQDA
ncbi:MAG: LLM class flavin-dependent oxidoreductase [Dehalococcoidia bacterium]|nr:LLM class flavin-dependent oxidoreductase [Dehalococcoidia bacterium]